VAGTSEKVDVEVTWAGGQRTAAQITRPVACLTQLSYYPQLAARARELARSGHTTAQIAERLNAEGFRPPKRNPAFTWACPRSPWMPGSGAAGPPATCTPRPGCSWSAPILPRPSGSGPCTRCRAASTIAALAEESSRIHEH